MLYSLSIGVCIKWLGFRQNVNPMNFWLCRCDCWYRQGVPLLMIHVGFNTPPSHPVSIHRVLVANSLPGIFWCFIKLFFRSETCLECLAVFHLHVLGSVFKSKNNATFSVCMRLLTYPRIQSQLSVLRAPLSPSWKRRKMRWTCWSRQCKLHFVTCWILGLGQLIELS